MLCPTNSGSEGSLACQISQHVGPVRSIDVNPFQECIDYTHTCAHANTRTHKHTNTHRNVRTRTNTHTHTHAHT